MAVLELGNLYGTVGCTSSEDQFVISARALHIKIFDYGKKELIYGEVGGDRTSAPDLRPGGK